MNVDSGASQLETKDLSMSHDQKEMTLLPPMEKCPMDFNHRVVFTTHI